MKSEFKAKLLQHLVARKNNQEGFTLIELLVVIIIIGILAAIALPSFLNQANKAKESEAKQYIGSMNRTQQAYFLERNSFSSDIALLGLGIKTDTANFTYNIPTPTNTQVINLSHPKNTNTLRAYVGAVETGLTAAGTAGEATTLAVLCQSEKPADGATTAITPGSPTSNVGPRCAIPTWIDLGS